MTTPKVQQYNKKNAYPAFTLFALCKGLNSGKPLEKPCPNCFANYAELRKNLIFTSPLFTVFGLQKVFTLC